MHRTLLLLGALAAAALMGWGAILTINAIDGLADGARSGETRTPLPGTRYVELESRKYVLYYEVDSGFADGFSDTSDVPIPPLDVTIRRDGDGPPLPLEEYSGNFEVSSGGRTGVAWRTVDVPREGPYQVIAGPEVRAPASAIVLGRPVTARVVRLVLGLAGLLSGLGLAVLVAAIAIGLRVRGRSQPPPGVTLQS